MSWSTTSFSSATGRPSPGPQIFSKRAVQCSLESKITAFSVTSSPGKLLFRFEMKAGGMTSSTIARAKKHPVMVYWRIGEDMIHEQRSLWKEGRVKDTEVMCSPLRPVYQCINLQANLIRFRSPSPHQSHPMEMDASKSKACSQVPFLWDFYPDSNWSPSSQLQDDTPYTSFLQ